MTIMFIQPLKMPAAPRPAITEVSPKHRLISLGFLQIARPMMKAIELGAEPHTADWDVISKKEGSELEVCILQFQIT